MFVNNVLVEIRNADMTTPKKNNKRERSKMQTGKSGRDEYNGSMENHHTEQAEAARGRAAMIVSDMDNNNVGSSNYNENFKVQNPRRLFSAAVRERATQTDEELYNFYQGKRPKSLAGRLKNNLSP